MKTRICTSCYNRQERTLKFCTKCGKEFIEKAPRKPLITKERLPVIGSIGVIGIALSLLEILNFEEIPISPIVIYITGVMVLCLGLGATYILKKRASIKDGPLILLLMTYEVIFLTTQYIYDAMNITEFSRYSILIAGLIVLTISASSRRFFEQSTFQSVHLVLGVYFGWGTIFLISGSTYLSPIVFTIVASLSIAITNYSSIRYPDVVTSSAYNIIEALVMINAIFISFSYFFVIALIIFVGNPLLLLKYKNPDITKFLIYISLFPTAAALYGIASGALVNPLPQVLFIVFSISWAWYLSRSELPKQIIANLSLWLSAILMFGVSIYALSFSGLDVLLTYLGISLVISILVFNIDHRTRRKIQLVNILLMFFVELILYPSYLSLGGLILFFIGNIPIIFLQDIRLKVYSSNILALGQIMLTAFFSIIYAIPLRTDDLVYYQLYLGNILGLAILYLGQKKLNYDWRYLLLVTNFTVSSIVVMLMTDISGFMLWGVIIGILLIVMVFVDRELIRSDINILGWLIILGLQLLIISQSESIFVMDLSVIFMLILAIVSYFMKSDNLTKYYLPLIIASSVLAVRAITHLDTILIMRSSSTWSIILLLEFILYTGLMVLFPLISNLIKRQNEKEHLISWVHFHHLAYLLVWMFVGKLIHSMSLGIEDELLGEVVIIIMQLGIIALLGLSIFNRLGSYKDNEKFSIIPLSLMLNIIIYLFDPGYYNEIVAYIYILIVAFYSIRLMLTIEIRQSWLILWFAMLSVNLIIIAGFAELSAYVSLFAGYVILQAINVIYSRTINIPRYYVTFAFNVVFIAAAIISRVLPISENFSIVNSLICWIIIVVTTHIVQIIRSDAMKEELIFTSILTIFSSMFWLDIDIAWLSSLMILIGLVSVALSYKILLRGIEKEHLPKLTFEIMSILLAFVGIILSVVQLLLYNQVIEILLLNRIIFWSSMGLFVILALIRKLVNKLTVILDVMIILSFLLVISTNLLAYFDSVLSNIVFLTLAMSFSIGGLIFKDYGTFYLGVGISILSALKALIDLVVIESSEKWFSVLIASVQLIWYTIVYSGPIDRIDIKQELKNN